jgi:hypothetical protein
VAFSQKLINVALSYNTGNFGNVSSGGGAGNSGTLSGLRVQCHISTPGGIAGQSSATLAIFGMTQSDMNQYTLFGLDPTAVGGNNVTITAGDAATGMAEIFTGTVYLAWMDATSMPRVAFRVESYYGTFESVKKTAPISMSGSADVATVFQQIAGNMGVSFENGGVNTKINNLYLPGTLYTQAESLARMAGIQWVMEKGKLAIWPNGQSRQSSSSTPVVLSPTTGMIGYPAFNSNGVIVKTLFQPTINYGTEFTIQGSAVTPANRTWTMKHMEIDIDSFVPHGQWMLTLYGYPVGGPTQAAGAGHG